MAIHTLWMLSSVWDLGEWWERLAVNVKVATVLGSIPASSDTVESEGRQMRQWWITYSFCVVSLGWLCEDAQFRSPYSMMRVGFTLKPEHPLSVYAEFHSFQSLRVQSFIPFNLWGCRVSFLSISEGAEFHSFQSLRMQSFIPFNLWGCRVSFLSISEDAEFHSFQSLRVQSFTLRLQIRTLFCLCEYTALQSFSRYTLSTQSNNFIRTLSWLCKSADFLLQFWELYSACSLGSIVLFKNEKCTNLRSWVRVKRCEVFVCSKK
jgi:hypothetical protein